MKAVKHLYCYEDKMSIPDWVERAGRCERLGEKDFRIEVKSGKFYKVVDQTEDYFTIKTEFGTLFNIGMRLDDWRVHYSHSFIIPHKDKLLIRKINLNNILK